MVLNLYPRHSPSLMAKGSWLTDTAWNPLSVLSTAHAFAVHGKKGLAALHQMLSVWVAGQRWCVSLVVLFSKDKLLRWEGATGWNHVYTGSPTTHSYMNLLSINITSQFQSGFTIKWKEVTFHLKLNFKLSVLFFFFF